MQMPEVAALCNEGQEFSIWFNNTEKLSSLQQRYRIAQEYGYF